MVTGTIEGGTGGIEQIIGITGVHIIIVGLTMIHGTVLITTLLITMEVGIVIMETIIMDIMAITTTITIITIIITITQAIIKAAILGQEEVLTDKLLRLREEQKIQDFKAGIQILRFLKVM